MTAPGWRRPLGPLFLAFVCIATIIYLDRDGRLLVAQHHGEYLTFDLTKGSILTFNTSGIENFIMAFKDASKPRPRRLVLMCATSSFQCGGIADRTRGIPYALSLAIITGRQFVVHPSVLTNAPVLPDRSPPRPHYTFVDDYCDRPELLKALSEEPLEDAYVTSNCKWSVPNKTSLPDGMTPGPSVDAILQDCGGVPHRCGAAVIHLTDAFSAGLKRAQMVVESLTMLPYRNYTALHIRAGGSTVTVNNAAMSAVPWDDGHASSIPQAWIDLFQRHPFRRCSKDLAIISDSQRLVSELRLAASDDLALIHCCSQPLHRDRYTAERFPIQEVIDLYVLCRSRHIIASYGGFGALGRYWLGGPGPLLTVARLPEEVDALEDSIIYEAACERKR